MGAGRRGTGILRAPGRLGRFAGDVTAAGWEYHDEPGARVVARLSLTTEQAWRLLTNNLSAAGQSRLTASGDNAITGILLRTRAIIGSPKWA